MIFICIFFITYFFALSSVNNKKEISKNLSIDNMFLFFMISFFLILLSGTRYECGADYLNYKSLYNSKNLIDSPEIVYYSLSYLFNKKEISFNLFLFCMATFSIGGKLLFYYRNTKERFLAITSFLSITYSIYEIGFIRQSLALCFCCFSFQYLFKKKYVKMFIFSLFAMLSQLSTFVLIGIFIIYFLIKNKTKLTSLKLFVLLVACFFMSNSLFRLIARFLAVIVKNEFIFYKLQFYINNYNGTSISFNIIRCLIFCLVFNKYCQNKETLYLYEIGICIYYCFSFNVQFATRFYSIPLLLEPLLLDEFVRKISKNEKILIKMCIGIIYMVLFIYNLFLMNYMNYNSIIFEAFK